MGWRELRRFALSDSGLEFKKNDKPMLKAEDRKYLFLLFVLVAGLFVPNLILLRPALAPPYSADLAYQWHPYTQFFRESYLGGSFPLWNNYDLCGTPFLAFSNTGSLYPFGFLYLLPFPIATNLSIFFHLLLSAGLAYWFFRELGRSPAVSFIAALSWSMSGELFHHLSHITTLHTLPWVPLFFLATLKLTRGLKIKWFLVFLISLSLSFLGGDSESILYLLVFWLWWVLVLAGSRKIGLGLALLAALAVGFLLVSAQFFTLLELFHQSIRGSSVFLPSFEIPVWAPFLAALYGLTSLFLCLPLPGKLSAVITGFYPVYYGFLIFLGFWLGLTDKNDRASRRLALFYLLIAIYILFFALPYLHDFLSHIPLIGKLLNPHKMFPAINFSFLIIAGPGLDRLLKEKALRLEQAGGFFAPVYGIWVLADSFLLKPAMPARVILALILVLFPFWKRWFQPASWLVLVAVFDIYGLAFSYFPRGSYEKFKIHPSLTSYLSNTEVKGRYLILSPLFFWDSELPFSAGIIIKAETIDSLMRAPLWRYTRFMSLAFPDITPKKDGKIVFYDLNKFHDFEQLSQARLDYLDLVNLRWVISRVPVPILERQGRYRLVSAQPLHFYENQDPFPRAVLFHQIVKANSDQEGFGLMAKQSFNLREKLLMMSGKAPELNGRGSSEPEFISLFRQSPDQLSLTFTAKAPGYLFLSETYFPGWRAFLDEKEARIWRADYAFRAIDVGPGFHNLEMVYQPVSFRIGIWVSSATAINLLLVAVVLVFRRGRTRITS